MVYLVLRLLHLLFMATWIGAVFFTSGDVRRTLDAGPSHLALLRDRVGRSTRLAGLSGILTIVTGIGMIVLLGGMGAVSPGIHIGLTIALLALVVGGVGIGGSWRKIDAGLGEGKSVADLAPLLKRMKIATMVFQTLWLVGLIAMVFRAQLG